MAVERMLACSVVSLLPAAHAYRLPDFSWDTLPVAWHSALSNSSMLSGQNLENLARYPLVTLEKTAGSSAFQWPPHQPYGLPVACQEGADLSTCGCCEEDEMVKQAKILKAKNPRMQVIAYMNSVISYPWYRAAHKLATNSSWWLRDVNGSLISNIHNDPEETWHTWDFSKPEVGDLWIEACRNMTDTGFIDGCFMDGCANYHPGIDGIVTVPGPLDKATHDAYLQRKPDWMRRLQAQAPGVIICGSNGGIVPGVGGTQVQNWGVHSVDYAGHWIPMLQQAMEKGVVFEAHASCGSSDPSDPYEQTKLAAFLIAAQKGAYYMCGGWGASSVEWYPLYDLPLGEPLGNATLDGQGIYTRKFKRGTVVTFNTKTNNGTIAWGSADVIL